MTETKTQPEEKNAKAEPNLPMHDSTLEKARTIIRTNAAWAFAGGIIPLPLVDVLAVSVVQLKMLNEPLGALWSTFFRQCCQESHQRSTR